MLPELREGAVSAGRTNGLTARSTNTHCKGSHEHNDSNDRNESND